jgi:hypothetical protein
MLVHSPSGRKVQFKINGIDVTMGSTLLFLTLPNNTLGIGVLQGQAQILVNQQLLLVNQYQALQIVGAGGPQPPNPTSYEIQTALFEEMVRNYVQMVGNSTANITQWASRLTQLLRSMKLIGPNDTVKFGVSPTRVTATPLAKECSERTFRPDGTVCIPQNGVFPCNRDGVCNNGEHSYICPEDCGPPPPPVPTCAGTEPC